MRYILLIIFTIAIYFIGSYSGVNTQTGLIEKSRNLRAENVKVSNDYRKNSGSEAFQKIGFIENAETKNNTSKNSRENTFISETDQEQDSTFELKFFLSMVFFTAFLVVLHFYRFNEKARRYQRFNNAFLKIVV